MLPYVLEQINSSTFEEICDQRFSESSTIDFKQELTKNDDKGKNELAKDVCAMANADGGDLVYGIKENPEGGTAESVCPLVGESPDDASRRLMQTLEAWVEPRITGLQLKHFPMTGGGFGVVLRVPPSFDGPHCVRNNSSRRFVLRNGTFTSDMTFEQLRRAFDRNASISAQAREFIASRLKLIEERRMTMPMEERPLAVVELVPLSGLTGRTAIDMKNVRFYDLSVWDGSAESRMNLDGIGSYLGSNGLALAQSQLFRNGSMEFITSGISPDNSNLIWATPALDFYTRALGTALKGAKRYEISGPALLTCAVMHVAGCKLELDRRSIFAGEPSDRPFLIFPEIYIEDLSIEADVDELLSDTKDVLYQAFGHTGAPAATKT